MGNSVPVDTQKGHNRPLLFSKWNVAKASSVTQKPSYNDDKPIVLVGPVIGLVTTNSARILLEVDREATVTVSLLQGINDDLKQPGSLRKIGSELMHNLMCATSSFKQTPNTTTDVNPESSQLHPEVIDIDSSNGRNTIQENQDSTILKLFNKATFGYLQRIKSDSSRSDVSGSNNYTSKVRKSFRQWHSKTPITPKRARNTVSCSLRMKAKRPSIFEFNDLEPGTFYKVIVKECHDAVTESSFLTFPLEPAGTFRIASISCNSIFITKMVEPISDLWFHLSNLIPSKVDLIVHIGDQIYGDGHRQLDAKAGDIWSNRFKIALEILHDLPKEEWSSKEDEICEKYREVYRDTWKHPPTAKCLATCPNLMIYDDHEIRDNWGDNDADRLVDSPEYFVARCAWTVMVEYQRQLYEDVDFKNLKTINKDHHFHVIGKVGFMFLDIRGSRTFHRVENDPKSYLGSRQWDDIKNALGKNGLFDKVEVLVVCSPAPLVFLEPFITESLGKNIPRLEDFKGHWSIHKEEQIEMINCLEHWKKSSLKRDVIVIGGDVHCGGHSRILKNHEVLFYQLTTSAIANMPLPKPAYYIMRLMEQFTNINSEIRFWHFNWTRCRNYGLVEIQLARAENETPEITTQLVKGPEIPLPPKTGKLVSNLESVIPNGCGCYQFTGGRVWKFGTSL